MPQVLFHEAHPPPPGGQGHALIIGISRYAFLPEPGHIVAGVETLNLAQVKCGAISALRFAQWLLQADAQGHLPAPLASLRLLIAPSDEEIEACPELAPYRDNPDTAPTWYNIHRAALAWRQACGEGQDRIAYFYFCGHAILRDSGTTTFLAQDFAERGLPILHKSFDLNNLIRALAPSGMFPEIARKQYYFLDCCQAISVTLRTRLKGEPSELLDEALSAPDDRAWPIFTAARPGYDAPAPRAAPTPFCEALIAALRGAAATRSRHVNGMQVVWPVRVNDLLQALGRSLATPAGLGTVPAQVGQNVGDPEIVAVPTAPQVTFKLQIEPEHLVDRAEIRLSGRNLPEPLIVPKPGMAYPYEVTVRAGLYSTEPWLRPDGPAGPQDVQMVNPGFDLWVVASP